MRTLLLGDEAMQKRDRRFFAKNSRRRHYVRLASDLEETGYRRAAGIPIEQPGICIMVVRQVKPGFRIRMPMVIPEFEGRSLVLPRTEAECVELADTSVVTFEFEGETVKISALETPGTAGRFMPF